MNNRNTSRLPPPPCFCLRCTEAGGAPTDAGEKANGFGADAATGLGAAGVSRGNWGTIGVMPVGGGKVLVGGATSKNDRAGRDAIVGAQHRRLGGVGHAPLYRQDRPGLENNGAVGPTIGRMPTRLVLIRHGESNVTVRRVIGGHRTCDGLSPLGVLQSERLADRWAQSDEVGADVVISSHFARARQTAEILLPALGVASLEVDPDLGEHDPGPDLDGLSFDAYVERYGMPDWNGDPHTEIFPGGETTAEFHLRVGAAVARLVREREGSSIVIVCHGGVIDAVFRQLTRSPPTGGFELLTLNTSITEFVGPSAESTTGNWKLTRYNDAAHLAGLPAATPRQGSDSTGRPD